jgi:hypothetical protein
MRFRLSTRPSIAIFLVLGGCSLFEPSAPHADSPGSRPLPQEQASLPPVPTPPPTVRPFEPQRLVGLTRPEVQALLGAPVTVREQPPALVWAYRGDDCGLELSFYLDLASKAYKALTYNITPRRQGGAEGGFCIAELRTAATRAESAR